MWLEEQEHAARVVEATEANERRAAGMERCIELPRVQMHEHCPRHGVPLVPRLEVRCVERAIKTIGIMWWRIFHGDVGAFRLFMTGRLCHSDERRVSLYAVTDSIYLAGRGWLAPAEYRNTDLRGALTIRDFLGDAFHILRMSEQLRGDDTASLERVLNGAPKDEDIEATECIPQDYDLKEIAEKVCCVPPSVTASETDSDIYGIPLPPEIDATYARYPEEKLLQWKSFAEQHKRAGREAHLIRIIEKATSGWDWTDKGKARLYGITSRERYGKARTKYTK